MIKSVLKHILRTLDSAYNFIAIKKFDIEALSKVVINGKIILGGSGRLIIGEDVKINSSHRSNPVGNGFQTSIHIARGATVEIGNRVGISNSLLYAWQSISIEDDVLIGGGCQIYDTDFHSINYNDRIFLGDSNVKTSPVVIKKGVFLGTSVIVLKGVVIGEYSVVAAGSVVVKNIPANEIWGGNPAKFIKKVE